MCNYLRVLPAPRNKNMGFTLVETIVAGFIFTIIFAALFSVLNIGDFSNTVGGIKLEVQQEVRMPLDWMVKDLRQTSRNKIVLEEYENKTFTDLADNLTFTRARFNLCTGYNTANSTISWATNQTGYDFDAINQTIIRTDFGSGYSQQFNNIANLTFTKIGINSLRVNITGQKVARGNITSTVTLEEEVKLRNE